MMCIPNCNFSIGKASLTNISFFHCWKTRSNSVKQSEFGSVPNGELSSLVFLLLPACTPFADSVRCDHFGDVYVILLLKDWV